MHGIKPYITYSPLHPIRHVIVRLKRAPLDTLETTN